MLADTFRSIKDMFYGTVWNNVIVFEGKTFVPISTTVAGEGEKVRIFKLPQNLTFDGNPGILVRVKGRDERWMQISS